MVQNRHEEPDFPKESKHTEPERERQRLRRETMSKVHDVQVFAMRGLRTTNAMGGV